MSNRPVANKGRTAPKPSSGSPKRPGDTSARVRHARQAENDSKVWLIGGVALFVVALALAGALIFGRSDDDPAAANDLLTGTVSVTGTALPSYSGPVAGGATPADNAVGLAVPTLTGQRIDGGAPLTVPATGKPAVVLFVAHWCPHCRKEVPLIAEHLKGGMPDGVDLFGVSTGVDEKRGNFPPGQWLRKEGWTIPTLADNAEGSAATAYGLSGFPFFVAVDASGKVVERASGELTVEQFDALVAKARGGGAL